MGERTTIHVVLDDEQKARWSSYAENEPDLDNTSQLVRTAVEGYISEEDGGDYGEEIKDIMQKLDDLNSTLQDANNTIQDVDSTLLDTNDLDDWGRSSLVEILADYSEEYESTSKDEEAVSVVTAPIQTPEQEQEDGE